MNKSSLKFDKKLLSNILTSCLFRPLAVVESDASAEVLLNINNLPEECVWRETKDGKLELTVLGYLNGIINATGEQKAIGVVSDNSDMVERVGFTECDSRAKLDELKRLYDEAQGRLNETIKDVNDIHDKIIKVKDLLERRINVSVTTRDIAHIQQKTNSPARKSELDNLDEQYKSAVDEAIKIADKVVLLKVQQIKMSNEIAMLEDIYKRAHGDIAAIQEKQEILKLINQIKYHIANNNYVIKFGHGYDDDGNIGYTKEAYQNYILIVPKVIDIIEEEKEFLIDVIWSDITSTFTMHIKNRTQQKIDGPIGVIRCLRHADRSGHRSIKIDRILTKDEIASLKGYKVQISEIHLMGGYTPSEPSDYTTLTWGKATSRMLKNERESI